jgi:hypothetical protein
MALPLKLHWDLAQTRWANILNPIIDSPTTNPVILKDVQLSTGNNSVNHKLGRKLQGWQICRQRAAATIYDRQDDNQAPQLTLLLVASAPVVVDLVVF